MSTEPKKVVFVMDGRTLREQFPEYAEACERGEAEARRWLHGHKLVPRAPTALPSTVRREDVTSTPDGDFLPLTKEWVQVSTGGGGVPSGT